MPPPGGLDWTIPKDSTSSLWNIISEGSCLNNPRDALSLKAKELDSTKSKTKNQQIVCVNWIRDVDNNAEAKLVEHYRTDKHDNSFAFVFRAMFQPSPKLTRYAEMEMCKMGVSMNLDPITLSPTNPYLSLHLRSKYPLRCSEGLCRPNIKTNPSVVAFIAEHGMDMLIDGYLDRGVLSNSTMSGANKTTKVISIPPIYVAADTADVIKYLQNTSLRFGKLRNETMLVGKNNVVVNTPVIFSLNVTEEGRKNINFINPDEAPDLSGVFFDMWMVSHSICSAFGVGGFGRFMSNVSRFSGSCQIQHRFMGKYSDLVADAEQYWESNRWYSEELLS